MQQNTHVNHNDITVGEFLYEFIEKYGTKEWVASTYDGNVGLLENYVHPYWGDKKLRNIRTKTVDDFYYFLMNEAEPATNMGKPKRKHISASTIHDIHKVMRCAFNQAKRWEYIALPCLSIRNVSGAHLHHLEMTAIWIMVLLSVRLTQDQS